MAVLKGHKDTADYLKSKGALPYSDLTNIQKQESKLKPDSKNEPVKGDEKVVKSESQSPKKKTVESPKVNGQDELDTKEKEETEQGAVAAAALAAKKAAEEEDKKKAAKGKTETKDSPRKSPDHKVEKKEVAVGIDKATVGVVTDATKEEPEADKTTGSKKEQAKKKTGRDSKGNGTRYSPSSLKSERSQKTQTIPIHVTNKKTGTGTRMGAKVVKGKVVETEENEEKEKLSKRSEVQSPEIRGQGKKGKHTSFDKDKHTDNEDSGNETDPGRPQRKKHAKYVPSNHNFVEEVQESVRQYQNKRNQSRELQQLKRAQIHTGPMHDIVMFSKMMDNYRRGHGGEEDDLDIRPYASWDGYLQGNAVINQSADSICSR